MLKLMKMVSARELLIDCLDSFYSDELKSILLNLNLNLHTHLLEDYKEAHGLELGADSSRSGESINWEQFKSFF